MRDRVTSEATSAPEAITDARDKALLLATLALDPNAIVLRGQPIATLEGGHTGPVLAVAFSPDGQLASAVGDRRTTRPRARVKQQNFHSSRAAREY